MSGWRKPHGFHRGALRKILREVRDERRYEIVALSGTSGGAVCAFLAWYALLEENNEQEAIEALRYFWEEDNAAYMRVGDPESVVDVLANDFLSASTLLRRSSEATLGLGFTTELNPYRYHDLFDYWRNRLKEAIEENVRRIDPEAKDIGRSIERRANASNRDPRLFIGAVNTLTGDFKVFKSHKQEGEDLIFNDDEEDRVGVDAVLASAAIPTIFEATRTGEAVYWDPSRPPGERACVGEGVYWDGLYSQNPPVRDLTEADPHELWVIQINPEEIGQEPKKTVEIEDRRNELSGNTSLNQELYFVRKINELIKRVGKWEYDEIPRMVFRIPPPDGEDGHQKKYGTIKVRRIELSIPLDVSSKLDRSRSHIVDLMEHGARQAGQFLKVIASQIAFEERWDEILSNKESNLDAVMGYLSEDPTIELVPPADPSSGRPSRTDGWKVEGSERVRAVLEWCRRHHFTLEQSRDYRIEEDGPDSKVVTCWALATSDHFGGAIKGRAEVVVREDKVEYFTFYPLSSQAMHKLRLGLEELDKLSS